MIRSACLLLVSLLYSLCGRAQPVLDSSAQYRRLLPISRQRDLTDVARTLFPFLKLKPADSTWLPVGHPFIGIIPQLDYSRQTRLLAELNGTVAYRRPGAKVSTISCDGAYSQNKQLFLSTGLNLWTANNHLNWIGDYQLARYPQFTYGLGTSSRPADELLIDFNWLRVHQTLLGRVGSNLYVGCGIHFDLHWNIQVTRQGAPVSIADYPVGTTGRSVSSGLSLNVLYDGRINSLNPDPANYANLVFRTNVRMLGSDNTYQTLLVDLRRYIRVPGHSSNIVALWTYGTVNFGSDPPYLDLPFTGSDGDGNSGRGYIQGRFRGRHFLYQEAEYRFQVSRNRLLGGVVFLNNQLVLEPSTHRFGPLAPGFGIGGRLQTNKFFRLNLAIDYGVGLNGSQGVSFNLGEYF